MGGTCTIRGAWEGRASTLAVIASTVDRNTRAPYRPYPKRRSQVQIDSAAGPLNRPCTFSESIGK